MKRRAWALGGAAVVVAVFVAAGVVARSNGKHAMTAAAPPAGTERVERGPLSSMVSAAGIVTYRARPDGSPYAVVNQARGTYTALPVVGDHVGCGDVLYRVDDQPVFLLCGPVPAYRDLRVGDAGNDVRQLNENLHELGYDSGAGIDPGDTEFTARTQAALARLQREKGSDATGELALGDTVFLPEPVRVAKLTSEVGGAADAGAPVAQATSDVPEVRVDLEPAQQGAVKPGDRAEVTLPTNQTVTGKVDRLGNVAQVPDPQQGRAVAVTIPAFIALDDPAAADALDQAPVQVQITTTGVDDVLSVPVVALVGTTGGGFAVEAVRDGGLRELVAVQLGLFDTSRGRVEVNGDLREGDQVVVPSP